MKKHLKCIVCEKELHDTDKYFGNSCSFSFGYSSKHDLVSFTITLCDICFVKKVANGTILDNHFALKSSKRKALTRKGAKEWLKELQKEFPEEFRKEKLGKLLG